MGKSVLGENEGIRVIPGADGSVKDESVYKGKIISDLRWMQPIRLQDKLQKIFAAACERRKRSNMFAVFGKEKRTNPADHAGETSDGRPISAASVEEAVNI